MSGSEEELFSIKSMIVEKDMKTPGRYWIWLKIHSRIKTVTRIDASLIEDSLNNRKGKAAKGKTSIFMGHHGIKVGNNDLPPLPLDFHKDALGRNLVVNFEVRSVRHPHAFYKTFAIVGPGVDVRGQLEK